MFRDSMQRTESEPRLASVECPTCGVVCQLDVPIEAGGDLVASTRRALFGEVASTACPEGHSFILYDC
jgi:hypothetical protein